jgi:hypothetical protein
MSTSIRHVSEPYRCGRGFRFAALIDEAIAAGQKVAMFVPENRAEEARSRFPGAVVITPRDNEQLLEPGLELTNVFMEERVVQAEVWEKFVSGVHGLPIMGVSTGPGDSVWKIFGQKSTERNCE